MRVPFGKFKGSLVSELPDPYLEWLRGIAREPLLAAVERELERRELIEPEVSEETVEAMMSEIIRTGFKALALKFHPDRSGSHEQMVCLNLAATRLRARLLERVA
jgi:hypothetical protein